MNSLPDNIQSLFDVDALIITLPPSRFSSQQYCEHLAFLANQAKKQGVQHLIFTSSTSVFLIFRSNLMKVLNFQLKQKWVKH